MKRILFQPDSASSPRARLRHAGAIAARSGGEVTGPLRGYVPSRAHFTSSRIPDSSGASRNRRRRRRSSLAPPRRETLGRRSVARAVVAEQQPVDRDPRHGGPDRCGADRHGNARTFRREPADARSVTEKVLRRTNGPDDHARGGNARGEPKRVLVPTDLGGRIAAGRSASRCATRSSSTRTSYSCTCRRGESPQPRRGAVSRFRRREREPRAPRRGGEVAERVLADGRGRSPRISSSSASSTSRFRRHDGPRQQRGEGDPARERPGAGVP